MICLNCAVYLEIKRNTKKFCSDKCRVYYSRKPKETISKVELKKEIVESLNEIVDLMYVDDL